MRRPYESVWGAPEAERESPVPASVPETAPPVSPEATTLPSPTRPASSLKRPRGRRKPHSVGTWTVVQSFADLLARERERRAWTVDGLAHYLDMHTSQYRKLENAQTAPTIRVANRVCRRLGVTFPLGAYAE